MLPQKNRKQGGWKMFVRVFVAAFIFHSSQHVEAAQVFMSRLVDEQNLAYMQYAILGLRA